MKAMTMSDKPNFSRKQAEEGILRNMRDILSRADIQKAKKKSDEDSVDRVHVFSVVQKFAALKRAAKIDME